MADLIFIVNTHPTPKLRTLFPFVHKAFHLTEYELPVWPMKVKSVVTQLRGVVYRLHGDEYYAVAVSTGTPYQQSVHKYYHMDE